MKSAKKGRERRLFRYAVLGAAFILAVTMSGQSLAGPILTGMGRFRFAVNFEPRNIFSGDLNEDGLSDFITLTTHGTVTILLSSTRGSFLSSARHYTITPFGDSLEDDEASAAINDFNGDGHLDLVVASRPDASIALYTGRGDGRFDEGDRLQVAAFGIMGAADLNRDGRADLLLGGSGAVTVLRGKADGTFHPGVSTPLERRDSRRAILADFNQDYTPDLVTWSDDEDFMVSLGNGDGTFAPGLIHVLSSVGNISFAADIDRDGRIDMVTSSNYNEILTLHPGNGDGTFGSGRTLFSDFFALVINGDFDGNGTVDLLTYHPRGLMMRTGAGDGTFGTPTPVPWDGAPPTWGTIVQDFDHDGRLDIASGADYRSVTVILGNGDGTFDRNTLVAVGDRPWDIESRDFNGDGRDDIVTANADSHDLTILLNDGGGFSRLPFGATVDTPHSIASGDLDGDGHLDVLVGQREGYSVFLGNGDGSFHDRQRITLGDSSWATELGDVDGNGSLDFVGMYGHLDEVRIFRNNGDGTFDAGQTIAVGDIPRALVVGDFDEDGRDDIAISNDGSDSLTFILRNGTQINSRPLSSDSSNGQVLVTADFNEDGHLDLFADQGGLSLFLGNGDGTFRFDGWLSGTLSHGFAVVGDFNTDGHSDVLARGWHDVSVLFGLGNGRFEGVLAFGAGPSPISMAVGDFDGDARTDVVTANADQDAVAILMNRINRAPLADAGTERLAECTAPGGTSVVLDGSASTDPDGDAMSFLWSGMNASFTDPASTTTAGTFPLGTSQVTLLVDDGERQDEAVIDVTVRDSTAPVLEAVLERTGSGLGTTRRAVDNGRLAVQFGASDVCDASPDVVAELQLGSCGSISVENGQLLTFKQRDRCSVETRHGVLKIEAPSLALHVSATDGSGNTTSLTQTPDDNHDDNRPPSRTRQVGIFPQRPTNSGR